MNGNSSDVITQLSLDDQLARQVQATITAASPTHVAGFEVDLLLLEKKPKPP